MKQINSINELLYNLSLPKRYFDSDFDIAIQYNEEKNYFFNILEKLDFSTCSIPLETLNEIKTTALHNFTQIDMIFKSYEQQDLSNAQKIFDELMKSMKEDLFFSDINEKIYTKVNDMTDFFIFREGVGNHFYRVRAVDYKSDEIQNNPYELFHLPFSKRAYSSSGRFGMPGYPCLYLSSELPLAWKESGYPKNFYYSEYRQKFSYNNERKEFVEKNNLKFLALYKPQEISVCENAYYYNNFDLWKQVIARYLKTYPLILASSFTNHHGDVPFKQEYIIPQMLMQWVYRNQKEVQGISYFTCHNMSSSTLNTCAYNVVFPVVKPLTQKGYSSFLEKSFNWSKPTYHSMLIYDLSKTKHDLKNINDCLEKIKKYLSLNIQQDQLKTCLFFIYDILTNIMILLSENKGSSVKFIINVLYSLKNNYRNYQQKKIIEYVNEVKKQTVSTVVGRDADSECLSEIFAFINTTQNTIGEVIDKYWFSVPEYLFPYSNLILLCVDDKKIKRTVDYFQEKNILWLCEILEKNNALSKLKKLCEDLDIDINLFWKQPSGDDVWKMNNMDKLIQPIIIKKHNNNNRLSKQELVSIGFNKKKIDDYFNI